MLFDGRGTVHDAVIARCARGAVSVQVRASRREDRESPLQVTLAQAVSSGERMDYTIQKAVELGVSGIQPLMSERCVVRLSGERAHKRVAHWQAVVNSACEQCGRNQVPQVLPVLPLRQWLDGAAGMGLKLLLDPESGMGIRQFAQPGGAVCVLAGPEGGLNPAERDDVLRAGFRALRLGPRILRTETAAVALLAAMQTLWGDFG